MAKTKAETDKSCEERHKEDRKAGSLVLGGRAYRASSRKKSTKRRFFAECNIISRAGGEKAGKVRVRCAPC